MPQLIPGTTKHMINKYLKEKSISKPSQLAGNHICVWLVHDAEAEAVILWAPDGKSQLTGKDPDAGKDQGRQEEKQMKEDEMVG